MWLKKIKLLLSVVQEIDQEVNSSALAGLERELEQTDFGCIISL